MGIIHYKNIQEITGDILKISMPSSEDSSIAVPRLGDLAIVQPPDGAASVGTNYPFAAKPRDLAGLW